MKEHRVLLFSRLRLWWLTRYEQCAWERMECIQSCKRKGTGKAAREAAPRPRLLPTSLPTIFKQVSSGVEMQGGYGSSGPMDHTCACACLCVRACVRAYVCTCLPDGSTHRYQALVEDVAGLAQWAHGRWYRGQTPAAWGTPYCCLVLCTFSISVFPSLEPF